MNRKGISQEGLKLIACVTMLIDHVGAVFVPGYGLRIIGRIAFPIYCFLMAEGAHYTRSPSRYALRLGTGMLLSEIPFDLALFGGLTWAHQSVMVTMLLGFFAICLMKKCSNWLLQLLAALPFVILGDLLRTDYGGHGVLLIALLFLVRELPGRLLLETLVLAFICWDIGSPLVPVGTFRVPIELFGLLAMVPISLYHGKKHTASKVVQWGFYLFYPVHLTVLAVFARLF